MEKVSIVLPCYNHSKYVETAIQSVLQQTYKNFELFVFDNGSTDNSWDIIQKIYDPRMIKIKLEKNDLLEVKKKFVNMASGKYFAIMHSDDIWLNEKLEKQVSFFKKHENAFVCFTWSEIVDEQLNVIKERKGFFYVCNQSKQEWWNTFLGRGNCLSLPSFMCKKNIYVQYFNKLYPYRQIADFYCWMKILQKTDIYILEEVLMLQRVHDRDENKNESALTAENYARSDLEFSYAIYKIIDEMDNCLFLENLCGQKMEKQNLKHIDIMCKKFLFFIKRGKKFADEFHNAIRYYNTYFDYEEDGCVFYQYLEEKYNFSRNDFFTYEVNERNSIKKLQSRIVRWRELENADYSIIKYPDSISIYGCGDIGKAFAKRIRKYCRIEQFIDSFPRIDEYEDIPVMSLNKAKLDSKSIIVIVPTYDFEEITENIKRVYCFINDNQMISIEKFINLKKDERERN